MTRLLSGSFVGIAVANFDYGESDRTTCNVTLFGSGLWVRLSTLLFTSLVELVPEPLEPDAPE